MVAAVENTTIVVPLVIGVLVVLVAILLFSKFTESVIEDDQQEEPKGSKWVKRAEAETEEDTSAAPNVTKED
eukprot:CAMPEP_0206464676 /NCGR_PEP_ID=MMETSP0324_2-20121206/27356_1 /ASSEMBLY_ACC=CAM_ASM_000836 /TAXON_ID=2866 /ORGANISM="Crypthecodinium cohnii, Strain Seligo" /LENGTH=71 /DNA_ID=CAMNT_0053937349 /DNA_START=154 /DNA_END=369 /DNA_ORIENTATION=+